MTNDGIEKPRLSYLALIAMVIGTSLGSMTQTGMNTALPQIMMDTHVSVGVSQWLVTSFQLCLGITIPTVAFLTKRYAVKTLFIVSTVLFVAGSFIIAGTSDFTLMMIGRIMEGVGTGIQIPLVQVVVFANYPRKRWGTIMGFVGLAFAFSPNIGPTLVGMFMQAWGWRVAFVFFGVLAAIVLVAGSLTLKRNPTASDTVSLDMPSLLLSILGFGILLLGISNTSDHGIASPQTLVPFIVGSILTAIFFWRETRVEDPLLDMAVFRDRDFTVGTIILCLLFCAFIGVTLVIPLGLQQVQGFSALQAGMVLLPGTIAAFVVNPLAGILYDRIGARPVVCTGAILLIIGTFGICDLGEMYDLTIITMWQAFRSFGISALIQPLYTWSVRKLDSRLLADGTSVSNALRQVAAAVGTAIMVLIMTSGEPGAITATGVSASIWFSQLCCIIIGILCFVRVKK